MAETPKKSSKKAEPAPEPIAPETRGRRIKRWILRGLGGGYVCRDESGVTDFRDHTSDQLLQVGNEFTEFKLQRLRKANDLKQALAAARSASDLDALNAVSWESAPV